MSEQAISYKKNTFYYKTITRAIKFLTDHKKLHPNLNELSAHIGLSEYHLQRIFSEWVGVSPKQFLQYLTKEYAKAKLKNCTVMDTALSCELSGTSRLYDLMLSWEAMTPGEYKKEGEGLLIEYGIGHSPFGQCFLATTHRGICKLAFFNSEEEKKFIQWEIYQQWKKAKLLINNVKIQSLIDTIFQPKNDWKQPLKLLLKGSPFQLKVWEGLLSIPETGLTSYQNVAISINQPNAVRAVASAIAKNNIAYLIPCHRVIKKNGDFGQYRFDQYRKQALIASEASKDKKILLIKNI